MNQHSALKILPKGALFGLQSNGHRPRSEEVAEWLSQKSVLQDGFELITYRDVEEWYKSGGETWMCVFEVVSVRGTELHTSKLVMKALVSLFPEQQLTRWNKRRNLLQNNGIPVSRWYWTAKATILEDFYPHNFTKSRDIDELWAIAETLDTLGFECLDFLNDIRCNEEGRPHYIDFGFDLGEPSSYKKNCARKQLERRIQAGIFK